MTASISTRLFVAATLAAAALVGGPAAHARSDVYFSIGIQSPPVYVQPAPVYRQPQPVYVQPYPVYVQPAPVYVQPRPIYLQPPPYGHVYEDERAWRRSEWQRRHWKHHKRGWDKHHGRDD